MAAVPAMRRFWTQSGENMKKVAALLLAATLMTLTACGVTEEPSVPQTLPTESVETQEQTTDPIVASKEEDPDTVVEGQVDISQLDQPDEQTTAPTDTPTEPSVPSETQSATEEITAPTEADGYYDIVIKP